MKDDGCTHISCSKCGTNFCYLCGLDEKTCGKEGNIGNIYNHNIEWMFNKKRCPMYLIEINDIDINWPINEENSLQKFHCLRTKIFLKKAIEKLGENKEIMSVKEEYFERLKEEDRALFENEEFHRMENSLSIHIKNLFNELSKHSLKNKYDDLVNISIFMKDFITYEPLNSCYRSKNCCHWEVVNKSTINTLLNKNCPLCCNKMEDFESDSYLEEIIKFKYYRENYFEEIMVDLKSGFYLPIETERKIDFEYILSICRENEKLIEQKSFNFTNKFYQFSIILPLNNDKIINLIPIRGKHCKHAEFFELTLLYEEELSFFVEFECKICKEKYNLFDIYLDSKCEQLINYSKKFFPNKIIKKIIYYPEWNCFQIEENYLDLDLNKIDVKIKDEIHSKKKEIERLINIEKNESFKNNYFYSEIKTQQSQNTNLDESENKEKNEFKILKLLTKDFPKKCNQIMELPDFTDYLPLLN